MEAADENQQRAVAAENAASAALIDAEATLQQLLRRHRPGSPSVDAAVTEMANQSDEYAAACDATVQAEDAYSEQLRRELLRARHLRRVDHAERILFMRHPQLGQRGEANVGHVRLAHIGQGQEGSGSLAPATPHGRPEPSGDDELPPAAKRLSTAMREGRDTPSTQLRTTDDESLACLGNG